MEQGLRQALRFTTFGFQTVRSDGRTLPERGAFPICDYVRATAELRRHAVVLRVGAILALVSLPALAAAQREVSPYAGFAGIERRLEAIAPEELAAHREATAVFEEARAALRDAAPDVFDLAEASGHLDTADLRARAEFERWAQVLEAADPEAYAAGRFGSALGARLGAALAGRDVDALAAVDEDLAEVLLVLIRAYAEDRMEDAGAKAAAALASATPQYVWAAFVEARTALAEAGTALHDAAPNLAADYLEAEARIRRTRRTGAPPPE